MNLYDGTVEGLRHETKPGVLRAVPSRGAPGPHDADYLFTSSSKRWNERERDRCRKRTDIKRVLVIGSGPIVIGQACEFDYSGTQACKALRAEGLEVVLVNSNPATIMTDPEIADRTYVEPLTAEIARAGHRAREARRMLPTVGGQTALNLAVALGENGMLEKYGVELIGASVEAIKVAEDRLLFRDAMREIGVDVPEQPLRRSRWRRRSRRSSRSASRSSSARRSRSAASAAASPTTSRSSARSRSAASSLSPVHEVLLEESVIGWKEFELEVMRDRADNFVVICSIENIDPMGVHTGDSITVAPALTLTDKRIPADARHRRAASSAASASRPAGRTSSSRSIPTTAASSSSR